MLSNLKRLADRINDESTEMFPCTNCECHPDSRTCRVLGGSSIKRCGKCACGNQKWDIDEVPVGDWDALDREEARLKAEKENAM